MTAAGNKRKPGDVLREARQSESLRKRNEVFRTVDAMKRDGAEITFAAVSRAAKVSQWLVYADGVREYILAAREAQAAEPKRNELLGRAASDASLRTDLELVRQENRRLRDEVNKLKCLLRGRLGEQLEAEAAQSLRERIDELGASNIRYQGENQILEEQLALTRVRLQEVEDDLSAARTSLRRMIPSNSSERAKGQPPDSD